MRPIGGSSEHLLVASLRRTHAHQPLLARDGLPVNPGLLDGLHYKIVPFQGSAPEFPQGHLGSLLKAPAHCGLAQPEATNNGDLRFPASRPAHSCPARGQGESPRQDRRGHRLVSLFGRPPVVAPHWPPRPEPAERLRSTFGRASSTPCTGPDPVQARKAAPEILSWACGPTNPTHYGSAKISCAW